MGIKFIMNHLLNRNLLLKPINWKSIVYNAYLCKQTKLYSSVRQQITGSSQSNPKALAPKLINEKQFPIFETKFRVNYSPLYWNIKHNSYDSIFSLCNPHEQNAVKKCFYGVMGDMLMSFFYPFTKRAKDLVTLTEVDCFFFLNDDYFGIEKSKQGFEDLRNVLIGVKAPEKPNELIIDRICRDIRLSYTDAQYNRFIAETRSYLDDCIKEILNTKPIRNVDDMIVFRESIGAVKAYLVLIPLSLGIDITEYADNPILRRMESLIAKHAALVNDIYSMKKEVSEGDTPYNSFRFMSNEINDFDDLVKQHFGLIESIESEFFRHEIALKNQFPNAFDLHEYMDGLGYYAGGNMIWSLICPRYNNTNQYSVDLVLKNRFPELIPEVEKNKLLMG